MSKCPECRHPFSRQEFTCNRVLANLAKKAHRLRLDQELLPATSLVGFCEDHDEPLKLFCQQDLVPICVICRDLPQHRGHDFLPTKNAVKYAKGKLEPYQTVLGNRLRDATKALVDQKKEMAKLEICTEDILSYISMEFEVLHQILDKKEEALKKTVEKIKTKNLQEMKDALNSLEEIVSSHTVIDSSIKTAFEIADDFAFLKDFKELIDSAKKFQLQKFEDYVSASEEEIDRNEMSDSADDEDSDDGEVSNEEDEDNSFDEELCESEEKDSDLEIPEDDEEEATNYKKIVVPVCSALKTFKDTLDFEAWKEMVESI